MILALYEVDKLTTNEISMLYAFMPHDRQIKFDNYRFEKDKRLCVAAYVLLLYGIYLAEGTMCRKLQFAYGKYGKPTLFEYPNLHFNFSHCSRGVTCALSRTDVGIDIQDTNEYDASLVKLVMSPEEKKKISKCLNPAVMFTRIWCCKESYLKLTGTGISCDLTQLSFHQSGNNFFYAKNCFFSVSEYFGCVIALCERMLSHHRSIVLDIGVLSAFICRLTSAKTIWPMS